MRKTGPDPIYLLAVRCLHHQTPVARAAFTRDWCLWNRTEAALRLADNILWTIANHP